MSCGMQTKMFSLYYVITGGGEFTYLSGYEYVVHHGNDDLVISTKAVASL